MNIQQHKIRLLELEKKISELIHIIVSGLDDEQVREAKENNVKRVVVPEETKAVMDAEAGVETAKKPEGGG
jgi:hypothetical protein